MSCVHQLHRVAHVKASDSLTIKQLRDRTSIKGFRACRYEANGDETRHSRFDPSHRGYVSVLRCIFRVHHQLIRDDHRGTKCREYRASPRGLSRALRSRMCTSLFGRLGPYTRTTIFCRTRTIHGRQASRRTDTSREIYLPPTNIRMYFVDGEPDHRVK